MTACRWQLWFLCDFLFLSEALRGVAAGRGRDVGVVGRVCVNVCMWSCVSFQRLYGTMELDS